MMHANTAVEKLQAGVKASGVGREHGPEALDYYLEPKGVVIVDV